MQGQPGQTSAGQGTGPAHVAIVGCGFTGTSALLQLVDRCPVQHITVFEASGDFGPGCPSRRDDSADHVRNPALDGLPPGATCHVLGASLSAYDVVNRLFSPTTGCRFVRDADGLLQFLPGPNQRRVLLCSRSGRLKHLQSRAPMAIERRHLTFGDEVARVLVDTTCALDRRIDSPAQPPLVRCLAAQGLLQPSRCGAELADGAAVDMATLRATGSRHVHVAGMWLWGPGFFTSSAFMMARAAQTVLAALYPGHVAAPTSPRC